MYFRSTLENVRALYPEALDRAVVVLRHSSSKRAKEPLVSFEWGFDVAVEVEPLRIADVVSGVAVERRDAYEALSLEDKLRDYERRCSVTIVGRLSTRIYVQSERLDTVPAIVLDDQRRRFYAEEAEKRQYAALSAEEKQRRVGAALDQLGGGKGFFILGKGR